MLATNIKGQSHEQTKKQTGKKTHQILSYHENQLIEKEHELI